jgi:hypothetical protein
MICGGHSRVSQRGHLRASRAWASERLLLSRWFTAPPPMCLNAVQQIPFRPAGIFSVNAVLGVERTPPLRVRPAYTWNWKASQRLQRPQPRRWGRCFWREGLCAKNLIS